MTSVKLINHSSSTADWNYLIGDAIKDLYDFSKDFKENPSLTDLIDSINHLLLSIGAGLAIGIAVTAFCLGLLIIYRTRKLEKDE